MMQVLAKDLIDWRRRFHRSPEISNHEEQTADFIAAELTKMGVTYQTYQEHFGLCATIIGALPGPVIAFRADMDALPIQEENEVEYRSLRPQVMHACGHDGHMAILLGLVKLFAAAKDTLAGTVKFIFQPAEEASPVGGAELFMASGILDDVSAIFGLHMWPDLPCGQIGLRPGALMAASDRLTIELEGQGAHAGQPHHGVDAIMVAADVMQGISQIVSRQLNPLETATISIGKISGGERYNVIARKVTLEGTVRTLDESVRLEIPERLERLLAGFTAAQGASYHLDYQRGYPILMNWPEPTRLATEAAEAIIGQQNVQSNVKPVLAAEDFGRYLTKYPGAFFWLGCGKSGEKNYSLHSPRFDMDEASLAIGAEILYETGLKALAFYNK